MTPEERAKLEKEYILFLEKEWRERWKEEHIDDIKHNGDFWQLQSSTIGRSVSWCETN